MNNIIAGLPGVLCHVDDILVFGANTVEHDSRLYAMLERIKTAGITLNAENCQFSQPCITFLGHVIDHNGTYFTRFKEDDCHLSNEATIFNNKTQKVHENGQPND